MAPALSPHSAYGRQAQARHNDLAVLEAARDVFTAQGAGAPVSAVAERAGVGMGTLYRRYGSKTELLQRLCLLAMEQTVAAAEAGLRAADPWAGLAGYITACIELRAGALAALAGHVEATGPMRRLARRSQERARALVGRAQASGQLRPDVTALDIAWLIEQFSRRAPGPLDPAEERRVRARLVAIALDGLRAPGPDRLPGRPPSGALYAKRWSLSPPPRERRSGPGTRSTRS
jgi:AcrR family transcriptional regulator